MPEKSEKNFEELSVNKGSSNRWKNVQLFFLVMGALLVFLAVFFRFKLGYVGLVLLLFVFGTVFKGLKGSAPKRHRKHRF